METCYGEEKSGFPVQPEEKIRKNRVFWSTYRESSYHTFDNSVVRHIRCLPRNLNGIFSSQMVKRSMGEPFWKGRLNGLIRLVLNKNHKIKFFTSFQMLVWTRLPPLLGNRTVAFLLECWTNTSSFATWTWRSWRGHARSWTSGQTWGKNT